MRVQAGGLGASSRARGLSEAPPGSTPRRTRQWGPIGLGGLREHSVLVRGPWRDLLPVGTVEGGMPHAEFRRAVR